MALPRSTSTRRAVLSYSQYKDLYKKAGVELPDLLVKDYLGIFQDFVFTADEVDTVDARVIDLEDSHYPNLSAQVQFLQQQIDGLPEFTMDTTGFTMDSTEWTMDKVLA
jgi:hypothetical protein